MENVLNDEPTRKLISSFALFSAICGFIGYGGWGVHANWSHGMDVALRSGLVQGAFSIISTLGFSIVMDKLFSIGQSAFQSFCYAAFGASFIMYALVLSIHWINETPELFTTVLPGIVVGSLYSLIYSFNLLRAYEEY